MDRRLRRVEWVALAVFLGVLLAVVLWPTPVDGPYRGGLDGWLTALHRQGVPGWFDYSFVQNAANVAMFAPFGALIASVVMRPLWWASGVLGLTLSLVIEFSQYEWLPNRFATPEDLAANTAGALVGGGIVAVARAVNARRRAADG